MRPTTLCLLMKEGQILLAMKKRGFGVGKWNGVGGKLEDGESIRQAAVREMEEEIGVQARPDQLDQVGRLRFYFRTKPEWDQEVHIFAVRHWGGEPVESEEMQPQWYVHADIPFDSMWPDDNLWLPKVLGGLKVDGDFHFNDDGTGFETLSLNEVTEFI